MNNILDTFNKCNKVTDIVLSVGIVAVTFCSAIVGFKAGILYAIGEMEKENNNESK